MQRTSELSDRNEWLLLKTAQRTVDAAQLTRWN